MGSLVIGRMRKADRAYESVYCRFGPVSTRSSPWHLFFFNFSERTETRKFIESLFLRYTSLLFFFAKKIVTDSAGLLSRVNNAKARRQETLAHLAGLNMHAYMGIYDTHACNTVLYHVEDLSGAADRSSTGEVLVEEQGSARMHPIYMTQCP